MKTTTPVRIQNDKGILGQIQKGFEPVPELSGFAAEEALQYLFKRWAEALNDGQPSSIILADVDDTILRLQEFRSYASQILQ